MLKIHYSDEQISKKLTQIFKNVDKSNNQNNKLKCLSNSHIIQSKTGSRIIYLAKSQTTNQINLILINKQPNQKDSSIAKIIPLEFQQTQQLPQLFHCELIQNKYDYGMFIITVIVSQQKRSNSKKTTTQQRITDVFIVNIDVENVEYKNNIDVYKIKLHNMSNRNNYNKSNKIMNRNQLKDVQWHAYQPFGLMFLYTEKILFYNLTRSIGQSAGEIEFSMLKNENGEMFNVNSLPEFVKIRFAESFNINNKYSSLAKIMTIYLISSMGQIYGIGSFICDGMILDQYEYSQARQILQRPINSHTKLIFQTIQHAKFNKLSYEQKNKFASRQLNYYFMIFNDQRSFYINYENSLVLFRLNNNSENKKNEKYMNFNITMQTHSDTNMVEDFYVLMLNTNTIFVSCIRNKKNQGIAKIQIFSEDPYKNLLSSGIFNYFKNSNFNIETVGQIVCGKLSELGWGNMCMIKPFDRNELYLLVNRGVCYKLSLGNLENLLSSSLVSQSLLSGQIQLIEIDIIFSLKSSQVYMICKNSCTIYLLRYFDGKDQYSFSTIVLQAIQLKQKIRRVNQQTEALFGKLVDDIKIQKQKKNKQQKHTNQKVNLEQFKENSVIQLQKKISIFSQQYKRSVERKLQRIKILYDNIREKSYRIQGYNADKMQIKELVNKAEQNDKKIQGLMQKKDPREMSKTQRQIVRRVLAADRFIQGLKNQIEEGYTKLMNDKNKRQTVRECQRKTDEMLVSLQELKRNLIEKRNQLLKAKHG